jgi:hypothetical protein
VIRLALREYYPVTPISTGERYGSRWKKCVCAGSAADCGAGRSREQQLVSATARARCTSGSSPSRGVRPNARGGELILQLHAWDEEDHPNLVNADAAPPGHGVLLWFEVGDFDEVIKRARGLHAEIILEPHFNPNPKHREMWLRDLDGYVVVIASPDGEAGS